LDSDIRVTLGVCVKDCEGQIGETIRSLMNQDFPHRSMEIIFVDDGSQDHTLSVIRRHLPTLKIPARVVHHDWKGLGATRNVVVHNAEGEYVIWVDCDMSLRKDFVRAQVTFMDTHPQVGIAKGRYGMGSQPNLVGDLENLEFVVTGSRSDERTNAVPLGTGGSIYRLEPLRRIGGFDSRIKGAGEDVDAEYRLRRAGWQLALTSAVFYERRRTSWHSLWSEYYWHGKGSAQLVEKDRRILDLHKLWPPILLMIVSIRIAVAYKLTGRKRALLLPFHYAFKRVAWLLGFLRAHIQRDQ
jgi:glycosyltransferase involved in cell wall biosynthesis